MTSTYTSMWAVTFLYPQVWWIQSLVSYSEYRVKRVVNANGNALDRARVGCERATDTPESSKNITATRCAVTEVLYITCHITFSRELLYLLFI